MALARKLRCFLRIEQFGDVDLQSIGDPDQHLHRRIADSAFHPADISAIEVAVGREIFLRDPAFLPQPPEIPTYALVDVHHGGQSVHATD